MSRFNTSLVAVFLSAAVLFPGMLQAMDIIQFDQMAAHDRQDFLDSLPTIAQTVLEQAGRSADAQKAHHLFNDISPGSKLPLGEAELELNLDNARVRDLEKHIANHEAPRVQVEVALAETLQKNGIEITPDFIKSLMQLTGTFKPKDPPAGDLHVHQADDLEKAKALLAQGGDVNAKDKNGNTLLHLAGFHDSKDAAALLLANGADVSVKNDEGWTPLQVAADTDAILVASLLLAKGADVNAKDKEGWTPLHAAAMSNAKDVAMVLLNKGADVNAKDKDGVTPLHDAAAFNCKGVASVLLANGADVNAMDNHGKTPLAVAIQEHGDAVADLLRAPPDPAPVVPAPADPTPSVTKAPPDDDDPIGAGGFIQPPPGNKGN